MKKVCKFCNVEVVTYVEHEINKTFGIVCIIVLVVFGLLSIIILPLVFFLTKNLWSLWIRFVHSTSP